MILRWNMLFLSSGSKTNPSKQTSKWQASFQNIVKIKVNLFLRLLSITTWKCMGECSTAIVEFGTGRQYSSVTAVRTLCYLYTYYQLAGWKAAVSKAALILLLNLNSTKINLFSGVIQSYYKQNSVDYVIHTCWIISRMQTSHLNLQRRQWVEIITNIANNISDVVVKKIRCPDDQLGWSSGVGELVYHDCKAAITA